MSTKPTPAQRHAAQMDAMRTRYETRLMEMVHEHKDNVRHQRMGAFWQGAFFAGAVCLVLGIVLGAVVTYAVSIATLPVAMQSVQDLAMFKLMSGRP